MNPLVFPLLVLSALASFLAGLGVAARWHTPFPLEQGIAAALHATWLLGASRKAGLMLTFVSWVTTVWLARAGFATVNAAAPRLPLALLLEGICLMLAFSIAGPDPWPDRLARWRRTRADILTQLRMGHGILPWARMCLRQFASGAADAPLGSDYQRFAAALADAEHRLRIRLNRAAVPERLRQSILGNVSAIVARAETSAAQRAIELEQQALAAAAACREQCERMEDLPISQRQALAGQCEQVFLELARP